MGERYKKVSPQEKKKMTTKEVKIIRESRVGNMKVTQLELIMYKQQREDVRDYFPERRIVRDRVVIQKGVKQQDGTWKNDEIWMTSYEFCKLTDALEKFDNGGDEPSTIRPARQVRESSGRRKLTDSEMRLAELADKKEEGKGDKPSSSNSLNSESERGDEI
jgi:hypothetical protein